VQVSIGVWTACPAIYDSVSFWVSVASLLASLVALAVAKSSLTQARNVADRDQRNWRQRTWFDLYFKADAAYDALDHFRSLYPDPTSPRWNTPEWEKDRNELMLVFRAVNRQALVFPTNSVIDALVEATRRFAETEVVLSEESSKKLLAAVNGVREKAFVDPSVLA
jgi:hypothetical protein